MRQSGLKGPSPIMIKLLSNWPRRMAGFLLKYIDEKGVMFGLSWSPSRKWKPVACVKFNEFEVILVSEVLPCYSIVD